MSTMPRLEQRVRDHARDRPDIAAAVMPERTITWAELDRAADFLASNLLSSGLRPGDRVGWLGRNRLEYPVLLVAARRARLVIVGLNWRMSPEELDYVIRDSAPRLVIADAEFRAAVPESFDVRMSGDDADGIPGIGKWMQEPGELGLDHAGDASGDDPVLILYTSGTTGRPKGVQYSLDGVEQVLRARNPLEFVSESILLIVPPVFHIAGGIWTQYALLMGMKQILLSHGTPDAMLDAIERWRVTHCLFVPTLVQMTIEAQRRVARDASSLRMIAYGAAPMTPILLRAAAEVFPNARFTQAYGMTEALGPVCHLPPAAHHPDLPVSAEAPATGFADPGVGLRIVDTRTGADLPTGKCGEVLIRTPWPQPVYWSLPAGSKSSYDEEGWLHTGDVGFLDAEGCMHLVDRVSDLIITGGENVYPVEVEQVLVQLPGVADAAVFALPDERWGEVVCAAIVAAPGSKADPSAISAACRTRLAHYKCPSRMFEVDGLPRNATGKVLRRVLRDRFSTRAISGDTKSGDTK